MEYLRVIKHFFGAIKGFFDPKEVPLDFINSHKVPEDKEHLLCIGALLTDSCCVPGNEFVLDDFIKGRRSSMYFEMFEIYGRKDVMPYIEEVYAEASNPEHCTILDNKKASKELMDDLEKDSRKMNLSNPFTMEKIRSVKNYAGCYIENMGALARSSYNLGYISKDECYSILEKLYALAADIYSDWGSYAIAAMAGRVYIYDTYVSYTDKYLKLANNPDFYFSKYPLKK